MFQVQGIIDNAYSKGKTSRAGKEFTINYIEVNGTTISTGFKAEHTTGEQVNIAVEKKYNEWQKVPGRTGDGLPAMGSAAASQTPTPIKGSFTGNKGKFPVEPTDGQMSIIRQSSMNRAVEIVKNMVECGVWKAKNEADYIDKILEVALIATDFGSGQDIMDLKKAQQANKVVNQ